MPAKSLIMSRQRSVRSIFCSWKKAPSKALNAVLDNSSPTHKIVLDPVVNSFYKGPQLYKAREISFAFLLLSFLFISPQISFSQNPVEMELRQALFDRAVSSYKAGKPLECIRLLREACDLDLNNQSGHFMYGSYVYQIALDFKRQYTTEEQIAPLAATALEELTQAIMLGKDYTGEDGQVRTMVGHAAFLMGDLFHYLYDEPRAALDYFEFAKLYWPDDPDLIREYPVVRAKAPTYKPEALRIYSYKLDGTKNMTAGETVVGEGAKEIPSVSP